MRRGILALIIGTAVVVVAAPFAASATYRTADEDHVQQMVNATRSSKGVQTLVRHDALVDMARQQAVRMAAKGTIFHTTSLADEANKRGLHWQQLGENVGMGPNVDLVEQAFLNSPHHYENIITARYNHVGIGVVAGTDGTVYVVQEFADLVAAAPQPAPATPASAAPAAPRRLEPHRTSRPAVTTVTTVAPVKHPTSARVAQPGPNALFGGVVERSNLRAFAPSGDQAASAGVGGLFRRFAADLAFWR